MDVSFRLFRGRGKNDPVVPFQFKGARSRIHWSTYALVALVFALLLITLFLVGMALTGPMPQ